MSALPDLFPGFAERRIDDRRASNLPAHRRLGAAAAAAARLPADPRGWHKIAPELARHCTLVIADLRGYGASSAPPGDAEHKTYSKRAMAEDCLAVMRALGHERFMVAGHDRGGRVAYRLALDHPAGGRRAHSDRHHSDRRSVAAHQRRWHAQVLSLGFLAQPHPMPETLIGKDPVYYLEYTLKSWAKPRDLSPFSPEALAALSRAAEAPARIHAVCEDYRAGASIDRRSTRPTLPPAAKSPARPSCCGPATIFRPTRSTSGAPGARTSPAPPSTPAISWPRKTRRIRWRALCRSSSPTRTRNDCHPGIARSEFRDPAVPVSVLGPGSPRMRAPAGMTGTVRESHDQLPSKSASPRCPPRGPRSRWRWAAAARVGLRTS